MKEWMLSLKNKALNNKKHSPRVYLQHGGCIILYRFLPFTDESEWEHRFSF